MDEVERVAELQERLNRLRSEFRATSWRDGKKRRLIRKEMRGVMDELDGYGFGSGTSRVNCVPEKRDLFSIWHIRNQRIEFPASMSARQVVECLTNGQCGD